jgi:hypothetical protein
MSRRSFTRKQLRRRVEEFACRRPVIAQLHGGDTTGDGRCHGRDHTPLATGAAVRDEIEGRIQHATDHAENGFA